MERLDFETVIGLLEGAIKRGAFISFGSGAIKCTAPEGVMEAHLTMKEGSGARLSWPGAELDLYGSYTYFYESAETEEGPEETIYISGYPGLFREMPYLGRKEPREREIIVGSRGGITELTIKEDLYC